MRVARPLYSSSGTLLINRGVVLTAGIIRRLVELGVPGLYIEDGLALDLPVEDVIRDETRLKAVQQVRELLTAENGAERLQRALVRVEKIARTIDEIIDELLAKKDLVVNLTDIRTWDDYTFCHSVNVCVLSLLTGLTLGLSRADLFHLGMGTILHDLGKVKVPRDILNKATRLTDEEFSVIKRHTQWGYQMAQEIATVSRLAATIPLQHHERYQGQGYPGGLQGAEIHDLAAICGIADVFDALTADRIYRPAVPVHEAYEYLAATGGYLFDYRLVRAFLENVAPYPAGTLVRLSTGEVALVVRTRRGKPKCPLVRVFLAADGRRLAPYELDLAEETQVYIGEVIPGDQFLHSTTVEGSPD